MNKQQLTDFAKDLGSHFVKVSDAHDTVASTCDESSPEFDAHKAIAASSADMADKCLSCLKVLAAADADGMDKRDYSQIVPTGVSAVAPESPFAGGRAVPRPGAPPANRETTGDGVMLSKVFGNFNGINEEEA